MNLYISIINVPRWLRISEHYLNIIENGIDYLPALKRFPQFSSSSGSASDDISLAELVAEGLEETS